MAREFQGDPYRCRDMMMRMMMMMSDFCWIQLKNYILFLSYVALIYFVTWLNKAVNYQISIYFQDGAKLSTIYIY